MDKVAVIDFGGQYNQLIARRIRDLSVYAEIRSYDISPEEILSKGYKALVFTGGPRSVYLEDSPLCDPEILKLKARQFLYLTDVRGYPVIDGIRTVFKYQAVSGIETELLDGLAKGEEDTPEDGAALYRAKYIGVASPIGRCLKTSFCLTLGQLLSQKEHVLYMNLEPCSGFTALFEKEFPKDLSDLLRSVHLPLQAEYGMRY